MEQWLLQTEDNFQIVFDKHMQYFIQGDTDLLIAPPSLFTFSDGYDLWDCSLQI